ncbi:hypothetical protein K504DRAFT_502072 [Pleomassaria siparia CBS 279.74]|uniref:Uncharacterized protein n=1 Tax=Pleomassaria siparia CBS 279.74 TaxID=1314801 RepID=A0A6G1KA49_9PLEO|nr:hypothetical protein K504DRAFT_502072 [Pleomassaria siparia CBS 279.74]
MEETEWKDFGVSKASKGVGERWALSVVAVVVAAGYRRTVNSASKPKLQTHPGELRRPVGVCVHVSDPRRVSSSSSSSSSYKSAWAWDQEIVTVGIATSQREETPVVGRWASGECSVPACPSRACISMLSILVAQHRGPDMTSMLGNHQVACFPSFYWFYWFYWLLLASTGFYWLLLVT